MTEAFEIVRQSDHSRFGGSSAERWMNCPGSTALIDTIPQAPESGYAAEGTAAHELAARCLKDNLHPSHFLGETIYRHTVTQEMCDAVVVYLNAVTHELAKTSGAELYVEAKFDLELEAAPGEVWGQNDALVYHPETGRLVVFDYKHGVGVSVSAEDNAQLKFYAAGAVFSKPDWKLAELHLVIVQPRAMDADTAGAVKSWEMDILELLEFKEDANAAVALAKAPAFAGASSFKTGKWCRWCPAAGVCPAKERETLQAAALDFSDVTQASVATLPDPKTFDAERLGKVLKAGELITSWFNQVQQLAEALALGGTAIPGWKVVEKVGRAKWIEADEDVAAFLAMMFDIPEDKSRPRKLTTIGEAEKLLKGAGASKDQIDDFKLKYTLKESSGLTLAPESDRRQAVDALQKDFGDVRIDVAG